jgi:DNA-binding MarR family transcriptional regulator
MAGSVSTDDAVRSVNDSLERLATAARHASRRAASRFEVDLQPAAWSVFREVLRGGRVQPNTVAADLGMDKSAVSRHLKELRTRGMVSADRDERDARVVWISATPRAVVQAAAANEEWNARLRGLLGRWNPEEAEAFAVLLARFSEAVRSASDEDRVGTAAAGPLQEGMR